MVAGDGRSGRRRCGHRNRPVVRDGATVARTDAHLRLGAGRAVRVRGDLLLPRGDLHRHLLVRMAAPPRLDALLDGYPDRAHRPRGRGRGDGGELLDELTGRVHAEPRAGRGGRSVAGLFQPGHVAAGTTASSGISPGAPPSPVPSPERSRSRRCWRSAAPTRPCSTDSPTGRCRSSSSRRPADSPSSRCWPPGAREACAHCRSWA